jgi:hypothetical protein
VDAPTQERADGEHDRRRLEGNARYCDDSAYRLALYQQVASLLLEQGQVRLVLENGPDRLPIELAICLRAGGAYGRPLTGVQGSELNSGPIRGAGHDAAQRIYLPDQVTLADAANGGIAAHLAERLDALGQQESARTHSGGCQCRFRAGMAAADDDHVKGLGETHKILGPGRGCQKEQSRIVGRQALRTRPYLASREVPDRFITARSRTLRRGCRHRCWGWWRHRRWYCR